MTYEISAGVGTVVAAEAQTSVAALDTALAAQGKLLASIVEAAALSKLPMATTQKLLASVACGMNALVASRSELASAVREMSQIQGISTLRETSFGCPEGLAPMKRLADFQPA